MTPNGLEGLSAAEIEALPELGSFMREGVETIEEIMAQDIRFVSLTSSMLSWDYFRGLIFADLCGCVGPDRFGYKMRALQGEFSPPNGTSDRCDRVVRVTRMRTQHAEIAASTATKYT
jgi:hypothetical protein